MQSFPHSFNKSTVYSFRRFRSFQKCIERPSAIHNILSFFDFPQVGNFSRVKDIVDIFKENLIDDLIISEQESSGDIFIGAFLHESLDEISESWDVVPFGYLNLTDLLSVYEGSQSCEGLLSASAYAQQKSISSWHAQNSLDPEDMLNSFIEEDKF